MIVFGVICSILLVLVGAFAIHWGLGFMVAGGILVAILWAADGE